MINLYNYVSFFFLLSIYVWINTNNNINYNYNKNYINLTLTEITKGYNVVKYIMIRVIIIKY